jgi:hypothetical protein
MIYIPIFIIIIILGLDLYFKYNIYCEKKSSEKMENKEETNEETEEKIFDKPNPWNKIQYFTHINKYFIRINNINEYVDKIMLWKSLPIIKSDLIDIDIDNNYLILKTHSEEEALVICNLIINYINNNLTINDIVSKNLINYSINKAKRYKLIKTKLAELIKEGVAQLNNNVDNLSPLEYIDTDEYKDSTEKKKKKLIDKLKNLEDDNDNIINNNVKELKTSPYDHITPYEGSEYASIKF